MTENITRSLALTKLQRPRIAHGLVRRFRLWEQLNTPHSLTFVLAPAGYGKTTLLSTWLETCSVPNAWFSLDEHDNELTVFVNGLATALHRILPGAVDKTLMVLTGVTLPSPEALCHRLLNDLAAIEQDFSLVLDDYHVIHNPAIHELLQELVDYPPSAMHLIVASRHDPPLPLARLRVLGHVVELRTPDLRLTPDETALFLREVMGLSVDDQTIALLAAKTEGWPVGLRLAALSLRRQPASGRNVVEAFASNRYVMDYLLTEVLAQLPISIQDFLIKTSFLDQLSDPLCAAVTGSGDRAPGGESILNWLDHADLFVVPVDEQRHWYRCHHLFRQLLVTRLQELYSPPEIAALQLRASAWFADNGYLDEALHHAVAVQDWTTAVQVVAQQRHELMNQLQWQRLDRWLALFPRAVIDEQPDLLLIEIILKIIRLQIGEVPALIDRTAALLAPRASARDDALRGELETRRCALHFYLGEWTCNLNAEPHTLEKLPAAWWYLHGYARLFLSLSYQMAGDLNRAYAVIYANHTANQSLDYQKLRLTCACFPHWIAADLSGMAQAAQRVLALSDPADPAQSVTWSLYHLGLYYYQRNNFDAAEQHLLPLVKRSHVADTSCFLNSAVLLARIRQAQHRPAEARAIAEALLTFALEIRSEAALHETRAFQAELALWQWRMAEAKRWAETNTAFLPLPAPHAHVPAVSCAIILLAQETAASREQACQLLAQMADYFTSIHYTTIRIQILALQAMSCCADDDEAQALALLGNAIALAEPGGFLRLFVDLGPQLKPLLSKLLQRGVSPAYVAEILAAYGEPDRSTTPLAPEIVRSAAANPIEPLTNREQEVLLLLSQRYTDKEIAQTLSISTGTATTHVRHIGEKLGAHGRRAIVQAARERGLLA